MQRTRKAVEWGEQRRGAKQEHEHPQDGQRRHRSPPCLVGTRKRALLQLAPRLALVGRLAIQHGCLL
jgi:hypothetical protein